MLLLLLLLLLLLPHVLGRGLLRPQAVGLCSFRGELLPHRGDLQRPHRNTLAQELLSAPGHSSAARWLQQAQ